jgi:hypothetical protein
LKNQISENAPRHAPKKRLLPFALNTILLRARSIVITLTGAIQSGGIFRYENCCEVDVINLEGKEMERKEGQIEGAAGKIGSAPGNNGEGSEVAGVGGKRGVGGNASGGSGRAGGPGDHGVGSGGDAGMDGSFGEKSVEASGTWQDGTL